MNVDVGVEGYIYQPLHSSRMRNKVNFIDGVLNSTFFLLQDQLPYQI